ncbi:MAG: ATP-dependent zinc metalloprotease FtsH [Phycisphaerae bacterium]|nr:ATP-dependent zinc metalloprotease FtsH [Phycisphaerae bacterium]
MNQQDSVGPLQEALRLSPNNVPLRVHLAEVLTSLGRYDEAETEFRKALQLSPEDVGVKIGLARAYYKQGKNSHALVIVEDLIKAPRPDARAYVLFARLLLRQGEVKRAVQAYKDALEADPSVEDEALSEQLGVRADPQETEDDDDDREVIDGRIRQRSADEDDGPTLKELERPDIAFDHVGGMDGVKDEIRVKIIHPLTHPEIYEAYGKKVGGGILMYGPPGCGKTHLARATAGEVKAWFLSVGISDVLDMWIGQSERNLHEVFEQARQHKPCVLFFDEVDALGASRADMRQTSGRHLINQFLSELDGIGANNEGVLVLAATNAPWHLDSAFRRPGRFDRIIFVPPPDADARAAILRIHLKGKPVADVDVDALARKTEGFSGADLRAVVDVAVEAKLREALSRGVPTPLSTKDLLAAAKTLRPTTSEWFSTARNYALYSNQGGTYDDILKYLKLKA